MPEDSPLDAPTALPGLRTYPALIIGALFAGLNAFVFIVGAGDLKDGFQWNPDGIAIVTPMLAALGIHTQVFAQRTVDRIAPRHVQRRVVAALKRRR